MAKKISKNTDVGVETVETPVQPADATETQVVPVAEAKVVKTKQPKVAKKTDKPNVFVRFGRWCKKTWKEMVSELKKVTWPKFPAVIKNTGVVLGVVVLFLVLVGGVDMLLSWLLQMLVA